MKKILSLTLAAVMMLSLLAACGSEKPAETEAPAAAPETTVAPEVPETEEMDTDSAEKTETEALVDRIYASHAPIDLPIMTVPLDLSDPDALAYNTGLASADKIAEGAVSELMMGQPYSLIVLKAKDAADAASLAQEMFDNIDQRKWICVEADTKIAGYYGDIAMLFMVGSDFSEDVTTQSLMEAFKTAAGTDVTVIE